MSEATSSPSGLISSSSSSLSSPSSAPISEPTSDEQPDLGAFVTVLREFNHLQPPPRIPIQIRTATSSTTPTFHSVSGAELRSHSGHTGTSRIGSHVAGSTLSSFTRPPSSSVHPEGSTVWNHALIASYLNNGTGTPSNDVITDEEYEGMGEGYQYTPASIALTVEIASETDYPSFDERSHDSTPPFVEMSPYPQSDSIIPLPVILESDMQRLDSRETARFEDDLELSTDRDHGDTSSATSRDIIRPFLEDPVSTTITSHSQNHSRSESHLTSIQLQSQARPNTTTMASPLSSLSYPTMPSSGVAPYISSASVPQQLSSPENNPRNIDIMGNSPTYLASLLNRSQNPIPPRTTSDSSLTTTGSASSSSLSLLSYQIIETPPLPVEEESDPETSMRPSLPRPPMPAATSTNTVASLSTTSLASLKTQRSVPSQVDSSSASTNSFATQRQRPLHQVFNESSGASSQTSLPASVSTLPNPHSPHPSPEPELPRAEVGFNSHSSFRDGWSTGRITARDIGIVNDLGTPDQLPLEVPPLDPPRGRTLEYRAVLDENVVDDISLLRVPDSRTMVQNSVYTSGAWHDPCIVNYLNRVLDLQTVLEHQSAELRHLARNFHLNEILCSSHRAKMMKRTKTILTDIHILIRIPLDITDKLKRPGAHPRFLSHDRKRRLLPILKPILLLLLYINPRQHLIIKV